MNPQLAPRGASIETVLSIAGKSDGCVDAVETSCVLAEAPLAGELVIVEMPRQPTAGQ